MSARRRNLAIFTAAAFGSGWAGVALNRALGETQDLDSSGAGVWLALPLATTVALRFAGTGWRNAGLAPRLRAAAPAYVVGALAYPVVTAGVVGLARAAGWTDTSGFDAPALAAAFLPGLGVNLVKNVFEESVWRGFLTEELAPQARSDPGLYLGVGAVWGLWHLPYYLMFLPEDQMRAVVDLPRVPGTLVLCGTMLGWTVLYTELYRLSGSIWPCVLMHAVEDALINPLVIDGHVRFAPGGAALASPITGVVTTAAYVAAGLALRAVRRRRSRSGKPSLR